MVDTVDLERTEREGKGKNLNISCSFYARKIERTHPTGSSLKLVSGLDRTVEVLSKDASRKSIYYSVPKKKHFSI